MFLANLIEAADHLSNCRVPSARTNPKRSNAITRSSLIAMALTAVLLALAPGVRAADVGTAFSYQGRLIHDGVRVNSTADFEFRLWDAATDGAQVGSTVTVSNKTVAGGMFTVKLDFGAYAFTDQARWLEVAVRVPHDPTGVEPFNTLTPRQELTPTPYAISAQSGGGPRGVQEFTDVGDHTWVAPAGVTKVMVELSGGCGGGGGGGSSIAPIEGGAFWGGQGGGGGAGGYLRLVVDVTPGQTYTVRIGTAGAGGDGAVPGGDGTNGTGGSSTEFEGPGPVVLASVAGGEGGHGGTAATSSSPGTSGAGGAGGGVNPVQGIARVGTTGDPGHTPGDPAVGGEYGGGGHGVIGTVSAPHGWVQPAWSSPYYYAGLGGGRAGHWDYPSTPGEIVGGYPGDDGRHGHAVLNW